jgi:pSer/pThr/pTyr-binding forkhead associated (FHA) protein
MPYIIHELHGARVGCYPLTGALTIGRSPDNHIVIDDPTVSAHHAVVEQTDTGIQIRDLDSTNGVLINGKRVPSCRLTGTEHVVIGTHDLSLVEELPEPLAKTHTIKKSWIPGVYYTKGD